MSSSSRGLLKHLGGLASYPFLHMHLTGLVVQDFWSGYAESFTRYCTWVQSSWVDCDGRLYVIFFFVIYSELLFALGIPTQRYQAVEQSALFGPHCNTVT